MRGNPDAHELIAPGNLDSVLELLAKEPSEWTPIAGGTEIMVAHAAGRLGAKKLVSLWALTNCVSSRRKRPASRLARARRLETCERIRELG